MINEIIVINKPSKKDLIMFNKVSQKFFSKRGVLNYIIMLLSFFYGTYSIYVSIKEHNNLKLLFGLYCYFMFILLFFINKVVAKVKINKFLKNKDNEKYFTEMKYYFGEEKVKIVSEYTESEMKWEIFMKVVFTDEYCFLFTIPYQGLCVNIEALNKNEIDELRLIIKSNIDENIITYL